MKKMIGCLFLVLFAITGKSQEHYITGKVKDEYGKGIANAYILLSDTTQISQQKTEFMDIFETDSLGNFTIMGNVRFNKIVINRIGYKPMEMFVDSSVKYIDIILNRSEDYTLAAITVKGYRQAVKMSTNRLEYNMKYSPIKQGSILDALRFIPLIHIDKDNIQIVGKEKVRYYLNGHELKLKENALNAYIKTLSVKEIEKIEVITSYDPLFNVNFNQGGINIVTKRQADEGLKGSVQARIWKTYYWKGDGNLQLSYKIKRLSANLFFTGAHNSTYQKKNTKTQYKILNKNTGSRSIYDGENTELNFQGLLDYSISKKSNLSGNANFGYLKGEHTENGFTLYHLNGNKIPYAEIMHDNTLHTNKVRVNAGLTYLYLFNKSSLFRTSINYYHGDAESSILAQMDSVSDKILNNRHEYYKEIVPQQSSVWSGDAVYSLSFSRKMSLALELNAYIWNIDNNDRRWTENDNKWVLDKPLCHQLKVKEWNFSGTISMQNIWSKKIRSVIGMGMRRRNYQSEKLNTQDKAKQKFWQPHPFLMLNIEPNKQFIARYNIDYQLYNPSFSQMNPFKWQTSATTYYIGNSNLSQMKDLNQNITIQFLQDFIVFAGHKYSDGVIVNYNSLKENGMIETCPQNMASYHESTIYLNMNNISYLKGKGNFRATIGAVRKWYSAKPPMNNDSYNYISDSYFIQLNNSTSLFPAYEIQMINSLSYNSKRRIDFTENPASINLFTSFQKNIKKWNFNLSFSVNSFIHGSKIQLKKESTFENSELYIFTSQKGESMSCAFQIGYNFGNKNVRTIKHSRSSSRNLGGRLD